MLFAGHVGFGRLAVLNGQDKSGHARLVVVTNDSGVVTAPRFAVINNIAAPDFAHLRAVVIARSQGVFAEGRFVNTVNVVAITTAGVRTVRLTSREVEPIGNVVPPEHSSIQARTLLVAARVATTAFRRSRPVDSMVFTGDAIPVGLIVRTTPRIPGDGQPPVLESGTCLACA